MKSILLFLVVFSTSNLFAQDQEIIKRDFQTVIKNTSEMKIDQVLDMTYPQLFKVMPKAQMRIKGSSYLLAIKDSYTKNTWKYLRYDEENAAANGQILSKEILKTVEQMKSSLK